MVIKHAIHTSHLFETDGGAELFVEINNETNHASIVYRLSKDHEKITIETDSFTGLLDLLAEAAKLIGPQAQG